MNINEIDELFTQLVDEINNEINNEEPYSYIEFTPTTGENSWGGIGYAGFDGYDFMEVFPDHLSILPPHMYGEIKDELIPEEDKIYFNASKKEIKNWLTEKFYFEFF